MTHYIRHLPSFPLEITFSDKSFKSTGDSVEKVASGLSFTSDVEMLKGSVLDIKIVAHADSALPVHSITDIDPAATFEGRGEVVWCEYSDHCYIIGVRFADAATLFCVRMIEQLCHIQRYRSCIWKEQGRALSEEQAAQEWVEKYAARFP